MSFLGVAKPSPGAMVVAEVWIAKPELRTLPMHSFLIAAVFLAILISPCIAAQRAGMGRLKLSSDGERSPLPADPMSDPQPTALLQQRSALLECVRTSQLRRIHSPAEMMRAAQARTSASAIR